MTITLADNVQPGQAIILVTSPEEMTLDKIYQVDQEFIILRSSPRSSRVSVGRGMFGSTRASHVVGTILTPVALAAQTGVVPDPTPPSGLRLIGPVRLLFSDLGIRSGVACGDIPAGSIVVMARPVLYQNFSEIGNILIEVGPFGLAEQIGAFAADSGGGWARGATTISQYRRTGQVFGSHLQIEDNLAVCPLDSFLSARFSGGGGALTTGDADIYALVMSA